MTDNILDDQSGETKAFYSELVGEGKKYRDNEALAKSRVDADAFIEQLKVENQELRARNSSFTEQSTAGARLEELVDRLSKLQNTNVQTQNGSQNEPKVDLTKIDEIISQRVKGELNSYETQNREKANQDMVRSQLKEQFGDNYSTVVKERIKDLGLSEDRFNALAKEAPQFLLKTLGTEERRETFQAPPRTSSGYTPKGQPKRTWAHYQEMKKSDPNLYRNPNTIAQMERDATALGEAFYDSDFNRFEPKSFDALVM
jgi:citrate lyase gamma subunit